MAARPADRPAWAVQPETGLSDAPAVATAAGPATAPAPRRGGTTARAPVDALRALSPPAEPHIGSAPSDLAGRRRPRAHRHEGQHLGGELGHQRVRARASRSAGTR